MRSGWRALVELLRGVEYRLGVITANPAVHRIAFDAGLTAAEVASAEGRFGFRFPPDLRDLLQTALPRGAGFPDWRSGDEAALRAWLESPRQGVLFDVEHNGFWLDAWGPRPDGPATAVRVAGQAVGSAPRLVPVFGHRFIPDEPHLPGNPILSVHQTDIIHYGFDLVDYLRHEFGLPREPGPGQVRPIPFWEPERFQHAP